MNTLYNENPIMTDHPNVHLYLVNGKGADPSELITLLRTDRHIIYSNIAPNELMHEKHLASADVVIANLSGMWDEDISILQEIRRLAPEVPLIVTTPPLSAQETRVLFKLTVLDWLPAPVSANELMESIFRAVRAHKSKGNRVHAVVSAVGGAGATTLAVSMADLAATKLLGKNGSVALFDLDFSTGDCGYALNLMNSFNLASVAEAPRRIDEEFIRLIQLRHDHEFYLYSFKQPKLNADLHGYELVLRLLDAVSAEHEQVFLDLPYYETEWKEDVLAAVNTVTLVTELHLPAIKHALEMLERIKSQRGPDFPVRVIFNKWETSLFGQRIGTRRLKELFGDTPFYRIPRASELIGESVDRGVPPSEISARSRFLRYLSKYMKEMELEEPVA